jgi:uncharacterized membrane protein
MENAQPPKNFVDRAFRVSLYIKAFDGTLQLIGGTLLLFVEPQTLGRWMNFLTRHLLSENPNNVVAHWLHHQADTLSLDTTLIVSLYMLSHAVIKLGLVFGLLKEKLWVFPFAFVGFGAILSIEIYRILFHFFWGVCILMAFDTFVLTMVILEYRKLKAAQAARA